MPNSTDQLKPTIYAVQALRFIAATAVVALHVFNRRGLYEVWIPDPQWLQAGVDVFFVISGFIMAYIIGPETQAAAFWLQRFTRIAPLYWIATLVAFVGGLILPDWFFGSSSVSFALQSALFLPLGSDSNAHPLISPGWTLVYEFGFYTLLTGCLFVRKKPFSLATTIIVLVLSIGPLLKQYVWWLGWYSDQVMLLEFLLGMAAALLAREEALKPWQGIALAAVGFVALTYVWDASIDWPRGLKIGLPAFLIVFGFVSSEPLWRSSRVLQQFALLGNASYAIYIVHFFIVSAIATLVQTSQSVHDLLGGYGFSFAALVGGVGAGFAAHVYVEKPLLRITRSRTATRRVSTA
jgi:peptidoglycan/LPS O-acetylase OafA/YrhL